MLAAAGRRTIEALLVALGTSVLAFLMIRLVPGDAAQVVLGANAEVTPDRLEAMRTQLGLDRPLVAQYFEWLGAALTGDLGTSLWTGRPVTEEILGRAGITAELTLLAMAVAVALALPLGCAMATAKTRTADVLIRLVSIIGITLPSFWVGVLLLYGAAALLPGVPLVGFTAFGDDPAGHLRRMILPVVALALPVVAALARVTRAALADALRQDYVRTARAKGVAEWRVVARHALRNALIPFTTTAGIMAGYLFGGSVVIEQVFAIPGLGRLMIGAIAERNYPLIQGAILLATVAFVFVNLVVDLLYAALDPRVRSA